MRREAWCWGWGIALREGETVVALRGVFSCAAEGEVEADLSLLVVLVVLVQVLPWCSGFYKPFSPPFEQEALVVSSPPGLKEHAALTLTFTQLRASEWRRRSQVAGTDCVEAGASEVDERWDTGHQGRQLEGQPEGGVEWTLV